MTQVWTLITAHVLALSSRKRKYSAGRLTVKLSVSRPDAVTLEHGNNTLLVLYV